MEINFQKLIELKKTREVIAGLKEYERTLSAPVIADCTMIKQAYEIFVEILSARDFAPNLDSVTQRKKFIFIALCLFAPSVLVGDQIPKGFRRLLAQTLNISGTTVSNNCDDIVFLYNNYKDFRYDVKELYREIVCRLKSREI